MCKRKTCDELLAYPTIKIVKVKDRYLGGIRYLMMAAIFGYIIGYVLVYEASYNECIVPDGSIQLSLKKPAGTIYPNEYNYCEQHPNPTISDKLPCAVVDERDVYQPVDQTSAMYIVTRFNQTYQQKNPDCANGASCALPWINIEANATKASYSAAIESFTIRFSHFFQARQFFLEARDNYYSQSCAEMRGKLVDINGETIAKFGNNGSDIVSLGAILNASGVDLNDIQDYPPDKEKNESNRHAGLVLYFGIDYKGTYKDDITYTYSVTQIPKQEYKVTRSTIVDVNYRLLSNTHGVKIFFVFSGQICRFSFQTMLIQMVAGLGLLSVATLTTDFLMEYAMPLKNAYVRYKYKETEYHDTLKKRLKDRRNSLLISPSTVSVNDPRTDD